MKSKKSAKAAKAAKGKPYDKVPAGGPTTPTIDRTLMTVNGRAIRQMGDGRMYVMRNDKRIYI